MGEPTSRRTFLVTTGAAALGIGVGAPMLASLARGGANLSGDEKKGPRRAMVVDLDKCLEGREKGCEEKCRAACHAAHNVPTQIEDEQEEVKWIWTEEFRHALPGLAQEYLPEGMAERPTPVLCNHCDNPPCVRVCPTKATWKREDGLVMMDMHRCIGCRYCIVSCPYGSRSFNWRDPKPHIENETPNYPRRTKGVVEKCSFCAELLSEPGDPKPHCVEACPTGALVFGDIRKKGSPVRKAVERQLTFRRKSGLGTRPHVFYMLGGGDA